MSKDSVHLIVSVLLLLALGLLVWGLQEDVDLLWQAGLGVVAVAMAGSLATRWVGEGKEDGKPGEEHEGEKEGEAPRDAAPTGVVGEAGRAGADARATDKVDAFEHRARAHEQRAEAHRELAKAYQELAEAEEERARGAEDGEGKESSRKGDANNQSGSRDGGAR